MVKPLKGPLSCLAVRRALLPADRRGDVPEAEVLALRTNLIHAHKDPPLLGPEGPAAGAALRGAMGSRCRGAVRFPAGPPGWLPRGHLPTLQPQETLSVQGLGPGSASRRQFFVLSLSAWNLGFSYIRELKVPFLNHIKKG